MKTILFLSILLLTGCVIDSDIKNEEEVKPLSSENIDFSTENQFRGGSIAKTGDSITVLLDENEERVNDVNLASRSDSFLAESALKEYLWNNEFSFDEIYINNSEGKSYLYKEELVIGDKYTITYIVFNTNRYNILIGSKSFIMKKDLMINFNLEIASFLFNIYLPLESVSSITMRNYELPFIELKSSISFDVRYGEEYIITMKDGTKKLLIIDSSSVNEYLRTGKDFQTYDVSLLDGYSVTINNYSYERAKQGFTLLYEENLGLDSINFSFKVDADSKLVLYNRVNSTRGSNDVIIGIINNDIYYDFSPGSDDIIPKGALVVISVDNKKELNHFLYVYEVCDEVSQLLKLC